MGSSDMNLRHFGELLSEFIFEIPDYQRGYSWSEPQWQALWRDIGHVGLNEARQHFTGMMLVRRIDTQARQQRIEVIDGQQRLVTVMIFANALRARQGQAATDYPITFNGNPEFQDYFSFYVSGVDSIEARLTRDASSYALNLKAAAAWFAQKVQELTPEQALEAFNTLLEKCCLFVLEVSATFDIHVAFETLNNRGRPLSKMELLKNRLIYLTTILEAPSDASQQLREQIHSAWKGIYRALGRSAKTQNHDDEFLQAHATAYFKRTREANWLDKVLLESEFSPGNEALSFSSIGEYVQSLEIAALWWSHIHAPEQLPKALQKHLERLSHAGFAYFKSLILSACLRVASDIPGATTRPGEFVSTLACLAPLLEQIERFVVVVFRLMGTRSTYARADMEALAHELLKPERSGFLFDDTAMSNADSTRSIQLVTAWMKAYICNVQLGSDDYVDDRFKSEGAFSLGGVQSNIEKRFQKDEGYYKWDFTRLALFEYEASFQLDGNHPPKLAWADFHFDETVEHIYPQTPTGTGEAYWDQHIPFDRRSDRGGKLSKALQNSLGNLLLLSRSSNSAASNEAYRIKQQRVESGKRVRFQNASYSATEVSQQFQDWNAQSIAVRGIALLKFIEQRWDIRLSETPDDLKSYLPLCFGLKSDAIIEGKMGKFSLRTLKARG